MNITTESGVAKVVYRRWVKKDGRVKFQERWFQSCYLTDRVGQRVLVGIHPRPEGGLWVATDPKPHRIICLAYAESSITPAKNHLDKS
jgi:hypothetical protein